MWGLTGKKCHKYFFFGTEFFFLEDPSQIIFSSNFFLKTLPTLETLDRKVTLTTPSSYSHTSSCPFRPENTTRNSASKSHNHTSYAKDAATYTWLTISALQYPGESSTSFGTTESPSTLQTLSTSTRSGVGSAVLRPPSLLGRPSLWYSKHWRRQRLLHLCHQRHV